MGVTKKKTAAEQPSTVPKLSKKEVQAMAETRLLNFLDALHRGQELPPKIKKDLVSQAQSIYEESKENAQKRIEFAEDRGVLPTRKQKISIWQNEFRKSMLERIEALVKPIAEERVEQILSSLPPADRKVMEAQRDEYVKQMQRQLALNPKFLKEEPSEADQRKQMLAMISSLEKQMAQLSKQIAVLKKSKMKMDR